MIILKDKLCFKNIVRKWVIEGWENIWRFFIFLEEEGGWRKGFCVCVGGGVGELGEGSMGYKMSV